MAKTLLQRLQERLGPEMIVGGDASHDQVPAVSTGSLGLDLALGIGGLPYGRIVEVFGKESSGKTTLCLHTIANHQKTGGVAAFVDAEHALDMSYAEALGVSRKDLLFCQPDSGEQALKAVQAMVEEGVPLVIVDSVAALVPQSEIDGDMGDTHVGKHARLMSQAMRKLVGVVKRSGTLLIFINQMRQKIGVTWGSPNVTTGGTALKYYASVRLEVTRIGSVKGSGELVGNRTRLKVVKNKLAPPFKEVELDLMWGAGFAKELQLIDIGLELKIISKKGSWFAYGGDQIGQGRMKVYEMLRDNEDLASAVEADIQAALS